MSRIHRLWPLALSVILISACGKSSAGPAPEMTPMPPAAEPTPSPMPPAAASAQAPASLPTNRPAPEQLTLLRSLKSQGPAPELSKVWLNSPPLKLADLRGKVVIVDFWTLGCINCIHVIPSLREWHNRYKDQGLVIIGVHTPEFEYEHDLDNVREAIKRLDVPYPVAIDNDWRTWQAYRNHYWPAFYFIDKTGQIRWVHIGEGDYEQSERVIRALLVEPVQG